MVNDEYKKNVTKKKNNISSSSDIDLFRTPGEKSWTPVERHDTLEKFYMCMFFLYEV